MIYNPLLRVMFALIPCFIIIGLGKTAGVGSVSRFMSSPFFGTLGRLSFCCYLIHPIIQWTMIYSGRTAHFISALQIAWGTCGDFLANFLLALALNLLFESPLDRLQKKIFQSFNRQNREPNKPSEQTKEVEMVERQATPAENSGSNEEQL